MATPTIFSLLLEQQLRRRVRLVHRLIARCREQRARIAALRSELAAEKREADANLRRAIDSELRCVRAMDKYRTERERAYLAEKERDRLRAALASTEAP